MIRDATILIRLTKEEKAQINKVARAAGGIISEWVREALLEKARMDCLEMPRTPSDIAVVGASTEEQPMKVNGEPPLDIPEIPLNEPDEPPTESGRMVDGEWIKD